jgi:predicted DNA-binding transcriptional regulator YafY
VKGSSVPFQRGATGHARAGDDRGAARAGASVRGGRRPRSRHPLTPPAGKVILTLTVAVREGTWVGLLYRCGLSEETELKVEPYGVVSWEMRW